MVFVIREAERAESAVHAIQAVHIAFALVRIGVQLALHEEALFQQRLQPWRPPAVVLLLLWTHDSSALGLDFANGGVLVFDRQLENLIAIQCFS